MLHTDVQILEIVGSRKRLLDCYLCYHGNEKQVFTKRQYSQHLQSGTKMLKNFANGNVFDPRSVFPLMEKNLFHAARATHKVLPLLFKGKNNGKKGGTCER